MRYMANRSAVISFAAGLLMLLAVCIAIIPVPFTGYVCFPAAAVLGLVAAAYGLQALRQFKTLTAAEKGMTFAGMGACAAGMLIAACSAVLVVIFGLRLVDAIRQLLR